MLGQDIARCFDFDDQYILYENVRKVFTDSLSLIVYRYRMLSPSIDTSLFQFEQQGILVDLLQETKSKCIVNRIETAEYRIGQFFLFHNIRLYPIFPLFPWPIRVSIYKPCHIMPITTTIKVEVSTSPTRNGRCFSSGMVPS